MSELKIEVSDRIKQLNFIEEMRHCLNKMPPPPPVYENTLSTSYRIILCLPDARILREEIHVVKRSGLKEKGRMFHPDIYKDYEMEETRSETVGTVDLIKKQISCSSEKDFENLKALAVRFKFKKLVKNWPGAK